MVISLWLVLLLVYSAGIFLFSVYFCYALSHKSMTWIEEVGIGILSLLWPILPLTFLIARIARLTGVKIIDKLLLKLKGPGIDK